MDVAQPGSLHVEGEATGGGGLAEEHPLGAAVGRSTSAVMLCGRLRTRGARAERDSPDVREVHVRRSRRAATYRFLFHESHQAAAVDG